MGQAPRLDVVRSAVRATAVSSPHETPAAAPAARGVVTISRETGTDAAELATRLAEALNERRGGGDGGAPWIAYDRDLVRRVAEDHHISQDLVAALDEHDKTWFEHLTEGIAGRPTGSDVALKVTQTICGLARVGRSIIVGRGSQCILGAVPGAVHVRLVAPLAWRVERHALARGIPERDAEKQVREIDRDRALFVRAHFHCDVDDPSLYTLVLNRARMSLDAAVDVVAVLVGRDDLTRTDPTR